MTNWKTLESFEAELVEDSAFRKAHKEQEADYRIAREILEARLAIGLSQKALAEAIGTSQGRVSKWESAEEVPRIGTLRRIANATGRELVVGLVDSGSGTSTSGGTRSSGRRVRRKSTAGGSRKRRVARKATAAKTTARKTTSRKSAARKSSTRKSATRKATAAKAAQKSTTRKSARRSTARKSAASRSGRSR